MKVSAFIGLLLAAAVSAAPSQIKRDDAPADPMAGMMGALGGIIGQLDFSKLDMPKLMNDMGPVIADLMPMLANVDLSKLGLPAGMIPDAAAAPAAPAKAPAHKRDGPANAGLAGLFSGGLDMSKIGGLLGSGMDLNKLSQTISPEMMKMGTALMSRFLQTQKALAVTDMKPIIRPTAKRIRVVFGPYKIKGTDTKGKVGNGFSLDPSGTGYMYSIPADSGIPLDVTIIDVKSGVFTKEASGYEPIDIGKGLYNHHNVFYDASQENPSITSCGDGKAFGIPMSIFMGGATESSTMPYTSIDGKFNSGYYLGKNAKIANMVDVVNYNKDDREVYTVSEIEYVPGRIADALPATSQVFDIGTCSGAGSGLSVHPPEGVKQWAINGSDITITKNGYFLSAKAHLHDGGVSLTAFLNGKQICDSQAFYGGPDREGTNPDGSHWKGLAGTTVCDNVVEVKKGDKLRIDAHFDIAAHPERQFEEKDKHEEGHGEMGGEMGMAEGMALFTTAFALGKDN